VQILLQLARSSSGQLSIKSKLILMLLLVSGFSTLLTAALGYRSGQINLTNRVFNQLTSVRASKGSQIEAYFSRGRMMALAARGKHSWWVAIR